MIAKTDDRRLAMTAIALVPFRFVRTIVVAMTLGAVLFAAVLRPSPVGGARVQRFDPRNRYGRFGRRDRRGFVRRFRSRIARPLAPAWMAAGLACA